MKTTVESTFKIDNRKPYTIIVGGSYQSTLEYIANNPTVYVFWFIYGVPRMEVEKRVVEQLTVGWSRNLSIYSINGVENKTWFMDAVIEHRLGNLAEWRCV